MSERIIKSILENAGDRCFVCGSVRFVVTAEVRDAIFYWVFYFQNNGPRYVTLTLAFEILAAEVVSHAEITCPAGQVGVTRLPWRVPEDCIQEPQNCHFIAIADYATSHPSSRKGLTPAPQSASAASLAMRILQESRMPAKARQMAWLVLGPIDATGRDVMDGPATVQVDFAKGVVDLLTVDEDTQPLPAFVQIAGLAFMVTVAIGAIVVMVRAVMLM
jgi:hypothetical protein